MRLLLNNKVFILISALTFTCFSLFPEIMNEKITDSKYNKAIQLGKLAFSKGDSKKTEFFFKNALERALELDNSKAISDSAYNLALFYYSINNNTLALEYISESEFENHLFKLEDFEIFLLKSKILFKSDHQLDAIAIVENLLKKNSGELKSTKDYEKQISILITLIHFLNSSIPSRDSSSYIQKSQEILPHVKSVLLKARFFKVLSTYFETKKELKKALSSTLESLVLYKSLNDEKNISETLLQCAFLYQQMKDPENASLYAYKAARSFFNIGDLTKTETAIAICEEFFSLISKELNQRILALKAKINNTLSSN